MSAQSVVWFFLFLGSSIGSYVPVLWGGSLISFTSVIGGAIGGLVGIGIGLVLGNAMNE